jgi:hypothetical protein
MRYTITGADRTTGRDLTQTIDANSPAEAESIASLTMLVSKVTAVPPPAPLPVVPANDFEAAVLEAAAKPPVAYATPARRDRAAGVDWMNGLAKSAWLLRAMSWVLGASALPFVLVAVREFFESLDFDGVSGIFRFFSDYRFGRIVVGLLLLAAAAFLRTSAHAALALRHLATRDDRDV